jgi:hypothetical protein
MVQQQTHSCAPTRVSMASVSVSIVLERRSTHDRKDNTQIHTSTPSLSLRHKDATRPGPKTILCMTSWMAVPRMRTCGFPGYRRRMLLRDPLEGQCRPLRTLDGKQHRRSVRQQGFLASRKKTSNKGRVSQIGRFVPIWLGVDKFIPYLETFHNGTIALLGLRIAHDYYSIHRSRELHFGSGNNGT